MTDLQRHLDDFARHERRERWVSLAATGVAIGMVIGVFAAYGFWAGAFTGLSFMLGVVAQRA